MRNLRRHSRRHSTAPARDLCTIFVFAILALATLGLSRPAFAHGLDVSASLFAPTDDSTTDSGEPSGFVELQITEEIGEICWEIGFEGIDESVDLIVRSSLEDTPGGQGEQPPLVLVATVTSGSADCVFRDIEGTTEITLDVDAHHVELLSLRTGDVLLTGQLRKPFAPGFDATDALEPGTGHSSSPWKSALVIGLGVSIATVLLANLKQKRSSSN